MATGNIYRFPQKSNDGTIRVETPVKNSDGTIENVSQIIFTSETPSIPIDFTEAINALIESGDIIIPESSSIRNHIVDISDQLESGRFTYSFVNTAGNPVQASSVYRVFFNGINVSKDVSLSEDNLSFTFIDAYDEEDFGYPQSKLIIDFVEKEGA